MTITGNEMKTLISKIESLSTEDVKKLKTFISKMEIINITNSQLLKQTETNRKT